MSTKSELRLAIKERLANLSAKDRAIESRVLCKQLKSLFGNTRGILAAYVPFADEPDIFPFLTELLSEGSLIALPYIAAGNVLGFRTVESLDQTKKNPHTNLSEPLPTCPELNLSTLTHMIVPGRAFTARGERLGRGNGGYDFWIRSQRSINPETRFIGIAFECQILRDLPTEEHDEKVDVVVTARRVFRN